MDALLPIVLYDDRCYLCAKFAWLARLLAGGRVTLVGHYTETGARLRDVIRDESVLDMFWVVRRDRAYGGRAALPELARIILLQRGRRMPVLPDDISCTGCKNVRAVFARSASLLTHSRRVRIDGIAWGRVRG